jgi:predicted nucleic acid-binding protein
MILYLDSSALVKRYIAEDGSEHVKEWISDAEMPVTAFITRVEVAAAIARSEQTKVISKEAAEAALLKFRSEWDNIQRLPITENTVIRGDFLACQFHLRGYDAIHLACAAIWQETLGLPVALATFDQQLAKAAKGLSMEVFPS